ncbi:hypothetical protein ACFQAS_03460 [Halopenitus salinus]|jgi:hypothetical protein|uniref:Uncharacterized protein n=1 Tax=Halopenitus salinus TaxID=1198295 RepID=A0ABD5UXQ4_9EURY
MFETDPTLLVALTNEFAATWTNGLADAVALAGPPSDLPSAVPDFVGDIHDAIRSFSPGDGGLGETIRDLTPGGGEGGPADAGNGSSGASEAANGGDGPSDE